LPHPLLPELERLIGQAATASGMHLCGVQLFTHSIPMTLQVLIRPRPGGDVTLDQCAAFSSVLDGVLESADLLREPYVLEVSSPGLGDDLRDDRDFRSFRGFPVQVSVRDDSGHTQQRDGLLLERTDSDLHINVRGRVVRIPRGSVERVRLVSAAAEP
jgi:ribosome maturation factor RimP